MPVVQARPLDLTVRNVEAERPNQMQARTGRRARSCDIAGILRDLRLYKDNIEHSIFPFPN